MEELLRLSRRVKLAKAYHNSIADGCYVIHTDVSGVFYVCTMTGLLKRYDNRYDARCDDYLEKWEQATEAERLNPVITFFPDDKIDTLPPHLKDRLLQARDKLKHKDYRELDG